MTPSKEIIERFKLLCDFARSSALEEGEQAFVVSYKNDSEQRELELVSMRELPAWLESHMMQHPAIIFSTSPALNIH